MFGRARCSTSAPAAGELSPSTLSPSLAYSSPPPPPPAPPPRPSPPYTPPPSSWGSSLLAPGLQRPRLRLLPLRPPLGPSPRLDPGDRISRRRWRRRRRE
ncbi:hypothetical protein EE612_015734 [Oryza sativa]|nr:hypothetical protein EE612_015734 [Oryza sativa]